MGICFSRILTLGCAVHCRVAFLEITVLNQAIIVAKYVGSGSKPRFILYLLCDLVTAEPVPQWPYSGSNKTLSCVSGTTEQNRKSCSQSMYRGKNFDLKQIHPLPPSPHPLKKPKDLGHDRKLNDGTQKGRIHCPGRSGGEAPFPHLLP